MTDSKDKVTVEQSEDDNSYLVVDPEDYQKTKKLESINTAKKEVMKTRKNRTDVIKKMEEDFISKNSSKKPIDLYCNELGRSVAQYGSELLPLIEEALEKGSLSEGDLVVSLSENRINVDVREFITFDGRAEYKGELTFLPETNSMAVYRQLQRIQRKIGLGLNLEEQKGAAEI
jgi:hypothetical protein